MNKTVELISGWTSFEEKFPDGSIEDFCRYLLILEKGKKNPEKLFGGKMMPPRQDIILFKLLGRIVWYQSFYAEIALEGLDIRRVEEFYFLNYIFQMKSPIKTDVIYQYLHTFSTGLNILDNLIANGHVKETDGVTDRRSKRVSITSKGKKVLSKCYKRFSSVIELLAFDVPTDDIELCIQLLKSIDTKFASLWKIHKGQPISNVYENVTGKSL